MSINRCVSRLLQRPALGKLFRENGIRIAPVFSRMTLQPSTVSLQSNVVHPRALATIALMKGKRFVLTEAFR